MDGLEKTNGGVGGDSDDRCPVEEVALVVPETDDPSLPVMTFRAWFLGLTIMRPPHLPQHLLHVPHAATDHLGHPHANRRPAHWEVHGVHAAQDGVQPVWMEVQLESWAVQHEGACHHHHLRQLWRGLWWG
jgi:hypothetical protein